MTSRIAAGVRAAWIMTVIAVTCLALSVPLFPAIFVGRGDAAFGPIFRLWCRCWFAAAGIRVRIEDAGVLARLRGRPALFIGNHQSALDIPLFGLACGGRVRFFAKRTLFLIPVVGWMMWLLGFTPIDRKSALRTRPALERAWRELPTGRNVFIVFPEATRSRTGELLPYRRGTFNFAKRARVPVVPFALDGTGRLMPKGSFAARPGDVRLAVGEPIGVEEVDRRSADELLRACRGWTEAALARARAGESAAARQTRRC